MVFIYFKECHKGDSLIPRDSLIFKLRLGNAAKAIHVYAGINIKLIFFSTLGLGLGPGASFMKLKARFIFRLRQPIVSLQIIDY